MWIKKIIDNTVHWHIGRYTQLTPYQDGDYNRVNLANRGDNEEENNPDISHYNKFLTTYHDSGIDELPSGIYRLTESNWNTYLAEFTLKKPEQFIPLKASTDVLNDFNTFKESRALYERLKLVYKRGVMLFGPPGTGKTSSIIELINNIDLSNSVVLFINKELPYKFVKGFKNDTRLKIVVFEEFTDILKSCSYSEMLSFLDGENSLENTFIIASTNYPEKLPENIINRPGRFDKIYRIASLTENDINRYLQHFDLSIGSDMMSRLLGKTIAELKEIILIHFRDGLTLYQALESINRNKELVANEFKDNKQDSSYIL